MAGVKLAEMATMGMPALLSLAREVSGLNLKIKEGVDIEYKKWANAFTTVAQSAKKATDEIKFQLRDTSKELDGVLEKMTRFSGGRGNLPTFETPKDSEAPNRFEGYVDPTQLQFYSEAEAIARLKDVFGSILDIDVQNEQLGRFAELYGYNGGGRVLKDSFEEFLQGVVRDVVEGRLVGMATGGIAMGPTAALIGEGGEPEAIIPLSRLESMLDDRDSSDILEEGLDDIRREIAQMPFVMGRAMRDYQMTRA
jgi:hypothetical protein